MNTEEWSAEKLRVFDFDRNICISAGAGSGKTATLVELNSRFLSGDTKLERMTIDQILAITFTEKAAHEMKDRIRVMIDSHLREKLDLPQINLWTEARRALLAAHISTFHSFCMRILREHPLEAFVDPLFEVAEEKIAENLLREKALHILTEKLHNSREDVTRLIADYGFSSLAENLIAILRKIRSFGDTPSRLQSLLDIQQVELRAGLRSAKEQLRTALHIFFTLVTQEQSSSKAKFWTEAQRVAESRDAILLELENIDENSDPSSLVSLSSVAGLLKKRVPESVSSSKKEIESLIDPREGAIPLMLRSFYSLPRERLLAELVQEIDDGYGEKKRSLSLLDFDDLLFLTCRLLRDNLAVRRKYKKAFKVILVDEFQDTNELQREIVYLIAEREDCERPRDGSSPPEEIELEESKLFIVGDVKQSIYFFRGADVEVFSKVLKDVQSKGGEVINFQENFRTLDSILNVLNPFFAELMKKESDDFFVTFRPADHLLARRKAPESGSRVELIVTADEGKASSKRRKEADAIARRILTLATAGPEVIVEGRGDQAFSTRRPRWGDIAILFRSLTAVRAYEERLKFYSIPYSVVRGKGFFRCQEVLDIQHVLRFVTGLERDFSIAGLLRSPLAGCTDETLYALAARSTLSRAFFGDELPELPAPEREKLKYCRERLLRLEALKERLSTGELVEEILSLFDARAVYLSTFQGPQKVANLEKLARMARRFDRQGGLTIEDFIYQIERDIRTESREAEAQISDEERNSVQIMSIHQAKGLEFPIVIVPDLGRITQAEAREINYSPRRGIASRLRRASSLEGENHFLRSLITKEWEERERAESLRLLYVAFTRARDYLILSGGPIRKEGTWRSMLIGFMGREKIESFVESPETEKILDITKSSADEQHVYSFTLKLLKPDAYDVEIPPRQSPPAELYPDLRAPEHLTLPLQHESAFSGRSENEDLERALTRALHFSWPPPASIALTPTLLLTYRFCRRKYLYDSVLGSREGSAAITSLQSDEGPPLSRREAQGWAAHRVLEEIDFTADDSDLQSRIEHMLFQLSYSHPLLRHHTLPVMDALLHFIDSKTTSELRLRHSDTLLWREHPFALTIPSTPQLYLYGKMDLLLRDSSGKFTLIDYKYSHSKDKSHLDYRLQIYSYALALQCGADIRDLDAYIVYLLDRPVHFSRIEAGSDVCDSFADELKVTADELAQCWKDRDESKWEKTDSRSCKSVQCPYLFRCW